MSEIKQKLRCAIYTRKSTEEGLEKEFNTLDAQRESGEAYAQSHKHEGWITLSEHYDDGGFSGGNTDRPGLKRLLEDIDKGLIDVVIVYKIDRLSRSLIDFTKLIDNFEKHGVAFVSVTQQFNTSTSMGRLTLNILSSFAQFEREVISERIRDKFAASKKKGMWMGGIVPLGYDVDNRKLIINEPEAELVRLIFKKFVETQSMSRTAEYINERGYKTKLLVFSTGKTKGGKPFTKQIIYSILNNRLYLGEISYKGENYLGQHEAIIDKALWDEVRKIKNISPRFRAASRKIQTDALLVGLLKCTCCNRAMVPTSSNKNNKTYRYYTSTKAVKESYKRCEIGSIPAGELEEIVLQEVYKVLKHPQIILNSWQKIKQTIPEQNQREVFDKIHKIERIWNYLCPAEKRKLIGLIVKIIEVSKHNLRIYFNQEVLKNIDEALLENRIIKSETEAFVDIEVDFYRQQYGRKIIVNPDENKTEKLSESNNIRTCLIKAFYWKQQISSKNLCLRDLSNKENIERSHMGRIMRMTLLAPDIVEAIIAGKIPKQLQQKDFTRSAIPYLWEEQRIKYGFNNKEKGKTSD